MLKPQICAALTVVDFMWPDTRPDQLLDRISEVVCAAEDSGFDAFFTMEQMQHPVPGHWLPDSQTVLAALAARTDRIQLGTVVSSVTYRNPAQFARITTTIDVLSGGRAIFGIGAGDPMQADDHRAYGIEFPPRAERFERLEESVQIARAMFTQERPTVTGMHHSIDAPYNLPGPIRGDIPILIGGNGRRKTLRLVAQYADMCNFMTGGPQNRELLDVLDQQCEDVGRDPADITRTAITTVVVAATHEEAQRRAEPLRAAYGDYWSDDAVLLGDPDEVGEQMAALREMGLDAVIASVPDARDLENVALAGRVLSA